MDYEALCEDVMQIDPNIRLVTICDMNAKVMHSGRREGVMNLLTPEESKKSLQQTVNIWKLPKEFAHKIGRGKYVLAVFEKVKRITIPLDDNYLLYVTTETKADHTRIIDKIIKLKGDLKRLT